MEKHKITFKIKTEYYLHLLTLKLMKLLGSNKRKITKDKNGKNVPHLGITEVITAHYNIVNNHYQQYSRLLYTFVSSKSFRQLLEFSPTHFIFLNTFY